jgi:hypothetical protein
MQDVKHYRVKSELPKQIIEGVVFVAFAILSVVLYIVVTV